MMLILLQKLCWKLRNCLTCMCCSLFLVLLVLVNHLFQNLLLNFYVQWSLVVNFCSIISVSSYSETYWQKCIYLICFSFCLFWIGLSRISLKWTIYTGTGRREKCINLLLYVHRLSMAHECILISEADFFFRLHILDVVYFSISLG